MTDFPQKEARISIDEQLVDLAHRDLLDDLRTAMADIQLTGGHASTWLEPWRYERTFYANGNAPLVERFKAAAMAIARPPRPH